MSELRYLHGVSAEPTLRGKHKADHSRYIVIAHINTALDLKECQRAVNRGITLSTWKATDAVYHNGDCIFGIVITDGRPAQLRLRLMPVGKDKTKIVLEGHRQGLHDDVVNMSARVILAAMNKDMTIVPGTYPSKANLLGLVGREVDRQDGIIVDNDLREYPEPSTNNSVKVIRPNEDGDAPVDTVPDIAEESDDNG